MEWGRVKSIMIGIFLVVNIFLFARYMQDSKTSFTIKEEVVKNTVLVLANNDVTVNPDIVPRKMYDVHIFDIVNKYKTPQAATQEFWNTAQKQGLDFFNPQFVTADDISFEYYSQENNEVQALNESDALGYAKNIVSVLQLGGKMKLSSETIKKEDDSFKVVFRPEHEGLKTFDIFLVIELGNNGGIRIYGHNWLCGNVTGGGLSPIRPVTEILVNFATSRLTDKANILGIKLGYYVGSRQSEINTVTGVPVWKLETSEGDYYYDARNGDLLQW